MKISIGSDHAGFRLKETIKDFLKELGHEVEDFGTHSEKSTDYPDFAEKVAMSVADKKSDFGILMCGTGIGMSIAANKVNGIRAALCMTPEYAKLSREHNDANILTLGARFLEEKEAKNIVKTFLETKFTGEKRHRRRIKKISKIEKQRKF